MAIPCRFLLMIVCITSYVACNSSKAQNFAEAELEVELVIDNFFNAICTSYGECLQRFWHSDVRLNTIIAQFGIGSLENDQLLEFFIAVNQPKDEVWNEVIWNYSIERDGTLAFAWTDYSFFLQKNFEDLLLHCGVNSYELCKVAKDCNNADNRYKKKYGLQEDIICTLTLNIFSKRLLNIHAIK